MANAPSLSIRLARTLAIAALCGIGLFAILQVIDGYVIDYYVDNSDYLSRRTEARLQSLQAYVTEYDLDATDTAELRAWCSEQPLVLMEITRGGKTVFNSSYLDSQDLAERDIEARYYDWFSYYTLDFADGPAEVFIYCDEEYQLHMWATVIEAVLCLLVVFLIFLVEVRKIARYIRLLSMQIQAMESGTLDQQVSVQGADELGALARSLDSMRISFLEQRQAEERSYQANQSLVTGLSHDLRTPLTKLMLYTEIVRSGKYGDEQQLGTYLTRIDEIAGQIKSLADNILHYSMAKPGSPTAMAQQPGCQPGGAREVVSFDEALGAELGEMIDYLSQQGFDVDCPQVLPDDQIIADRSSVKRLFDNIASNIVRYADSSERIRIGCVQEDTHAGVSIRNAIAPDPDRREGLGIGHANIASMMDALGGYSRLQENEDDFEITLWFQKGK